MLAAPDEVPICRSAPWQRRGIAGADRARLSKGVGIYDAAQVDLAIAALLYRFAHEDALRARAFHRALPVVVIGIALKNGAV